MSLRLHTTVLPCNGHDYVQNLLAMNFLEECKARGFFYQCTDEARLIELLQNGSSCYIGFDCTAESLHVGSLLTIMLLRLLQKHGVRPIALLGGATTKIGDPTGKDQMRRVISDEELARNSNGIERSLAKFIRFGNSPTDALMVNNDDWMSKLSYMDLLKNYGRFFSVNRMLKMDSVKTRLEREQNLTFLEFNYMILQAYDFLHLHDKYGCVLQCGGSDQWSNIISGVDLIKRTRGEEVVGLTTPLMTLASGKKMGKTEDGAVWLNEEMLSPYQYYQFWRNVPDADVFKFMRLYTDLSLEDISKHEQSSDINDAKKLLAFEATRLCHGEQHATDASATAKAAFEEGNMDSIETVSLPISVLEQGIPIADLFKMCGLSGSKGEAKRLIQGGGAKMNQQKVTDEEMVVTQAHLNQGVIVLSSGKKRFIRVEFN